MKLVDIENLLLYRQYLSLLPSNTPHNRLFVNYKKGKCSIKPQFWESRVKNRRIFKFTHPKITQAIAFVEPQQLFADNGGNITNLETPGGWKSTNAAEGYIDNSLTNLKMPRPLKDYHMKTIDVKRKLYLVLTITEGI